MMRLFQSMQARHEIAKLNLIVKFHFSNNFTQLEKCSAVIGSHMERHRPQSAIPVFKPLVDMRRPSPLCCEIDRIPVSAQQGVANMASRASLMGQQIVTSEARQIVASKAGRTPGVYRCPFPP
jgi:hypothetical protein